MSKIIEIMARTIRDFPMAQRLSTAAAMKALEDLERAGFVIVPVVPNGAMIEKGAELSGYASDENGAANAQEIYRAMIEAFREGRVTVVEGGE